MKKKRFSTEQIVAVLKQPVMAHAGGANDHRARPAGGKRFVNVDDPIGSSSLSMGLSRKLAATPATSAARAALLAPTMAQVRAGINSTISANRNGNPPLVREPG